MTSRVFTGAISMLPRCLSSPSQPCHWHHPKPQIALLLRQNSAKQRAVVDIQLFCAVCTSFSISLRFNACIFQLYLHIASGYLIGFTRVFGLVCTDDWRQKLLCEQFVPHISISFLPDYLSQLVEYPTKPSTSQRRKCFLQLSALCLLPVQIKLAEDSDTFPFHAGLINVSQLIVWKIPALSTVRPGYCSANCGYHVKMGAV